LSTKIWIQVLSAYSIACISLRFMCINRIQLKKRTKNAWSRIIFSELDFKIFSRVVKESASFNDSKRISSNWKNDSFENMREDFFMNASCYSNDWKTTFSLIDREITFSLFNREVTFSLLNREITFLLNASYFSINREKTFSLNASYFSIDWEIFFSNYEEMSFSTSLETMS
jgi:hypothetical protein